MGAVYRGRVRIRDKRAILNIGTFLCNVAHAVIANRARTGSRTRATEWSFWYEFSDSSSRVQLHECIGTLRLSLIQSGHQTRMRSVRTALRGDTSRPSSRAWRGRRESLSI